MKVLTLTQPWATLVAIGAKRIETRSWATNYRGPLLIHAAKGFPKSARELLDCDPFEDVLGAGGITHVDDLPLGVIVAVCNIGAIVRTEVAHPNATERAFGDYTPGRWAWLLHDIHAVPLIAAKGSLGLWEYAGLKFEDKDAQ